MARPINNELSCRTYASNSSIRLHWACWDDEYVVFEETSGQTQKMGPLRAYVLNALAVKPYRFDDIVKELRVVPVLADDTSLNAQLETVLDELVRNGMAEVTIG